MSYLFTSARLPGSGTFSHSLPNTSKSVNRICIQRVQALTKNFVLSIIAQIFVLHYTACVPSLIAEISILKILISLSHVPIPAHGKDKKQTAARRSTAGRTSISDVIVLLK